jgi:hypothetical protein
MPKVAEVRRQTGEDRRRNGGEGRLLETSPVAYACILATFLRILNRLIVLCKGDWLKNHSPTNLSCNRLKSGYWSRRFAASQMLRGTAE